VCAYDDATVVDALKLARLEVEPYPRLGRWRRFVFHVPQSPPAKGELKKPPAAAAEPLARLLPSLEFELPRVPDVLSGRRSRYFYAMRWGESCGGGSSSSVGHRCGQVVKVCLHDVLMFCFLDGHRHHAHLIPALPFQVDMETFAITSWTAGPRRGLR